jgi:hypothetical protein
MKHKIALFGLTIAGICIVWGSSAAGPASAGNSPLPTPTPTPVTVTAKPTPTPTPFDDPNEVIKVDTELVNLNVRVVDRNNRPINDLRRQQSSGNRLFLAV